jgi:PAS domain S-box-containing protein
MDAIAGSENSTQPALVLVEFLLSSLATGFLTAVALTKLKEKTSSNSSQPSSVELAELQRQRQLLVDRTADVVCVIDKDANLINVNNACTRAWGYAPDELIGRPVSSFLPPADAELVKQNGLRNDFSVERINLELKVNKKDGTQADSIWAGFWSVRESALFCIVHDVSEQKQLQRMKSQFFDMVSHDLRSPIQAIRYLLVNLSEGKLGTLSERGAKISGSAHAECEYMLRLLDDYLQIEKLESGTFALECKEFDLKSAIEQAVATMSAQAQQQQIDLRVSADQCKCFGDEQRITQVLVNLIGNAVKFSPERTAITVSSTPSGNEVKVAVEDQGRGIPADMVDRVFDKFEQFEPAVAGNFRGAGLGLTICKTIVEQHGGRIGVDSTPNKGSRFWFTIRRLD